MVRDTGIRERWSDYDPLREGETAEGRAARQHNTDLIRLARAEMETGESNPRLGQRARETAQGMRTKVLSHIVPIDAEFSPEDPRLAFLKEQFEALQPPEKDGRTWEEVCGALRRATYKDGTPIRNVDAYLAEINKYDQPRIYRVHNGQLVIGDGGRSVPSATKGMTFWQAEEYCSKDPKSDMIDTDEWDALQDSYQTDVRPDSVTWCKPGSRDEPSAGLAWLANWDFEDRCVRLYDTDGAGHRPGVRRVLRVNLVFES